MPERKLIAKKTPNYWSFLAFLEKLFDTNSITLFFFFFEKKSQLIITPVIQIAISITSREI